MEFKYRISTGAVPKETTSANESRDFPELTLTMQFTGCIPVKQIKEHRYPYHRYGQGKFTMNSHNDSQHA